MRCLRRLGARSMRSLPRGGSAGRGAASGRPLPRRSRLTGRFGKATPTPWLAGTRGAPGGAGLVVQHRVLGGVGTRGLPSSAGSSGLSLLGPRQPPPAAGCRVSGAVSLHPTYWLHTVCPARAAQASPATAHLVRSRQVIPLTTCRWSRTGLPSPGHRAQRVARPAAPGARTAVRAAQQRLHVSPHLSALPSSVGLVLSSGRPVPA